MKEGREEKERQNVRRVSRWVLAVWCFKRSVSLGGMLRVERWHGHVLQYQEDSPLVSLEAMGNAQSFSMRGWYVQTWGRMTGRGKRLKVQWWDVSTGAWTNVRREDGNKRIERMWSFAELAHSSSQEQTVHIPSQVHVQWCHVCSLKSLPWQDYFY